MFGVFAVPLRVARLASGTVGELARALGPRRHARQQAWARAQARAQATGKPLMVLGAPNNGVINYFLSDYGCGDLCMDLQGCPECPTALEGRAEDLLQQLEDDSVVAFVSCVLEYVDDPVLVTSELRRVAGPDLFVVRVEPGSLTSTVYPGARWVFHAAPLGDGRPFIWEAVQ